MESYLLMFASWMATDFVYSLYTISFTKNRFFDAVFWAMVIPVLSLSVFLNVNSNPTVWLMIPASLGAGFGTVLGIAVSKRLAGN